MLLILMMAASAVAASAQTPAKPAAPAATAAKPAATAAAKPAANAASSAVGAKLPPGIPPVKAIRKTAFSLQYQDIKIGAGPESEPNKMYQVHYTGWLAADGHKFDSSYDHPRAPVLDKDGKPVMGDDGKPKLGDLQPLSFPQGFGRLIPGWDQGFYGMKVGGKRRLFIPWQLAYGAKGRPGPDAAHPGIPAKADLIFDVEFVGMTDLPMPPNHPGVGGMPGTGGQPNAAHPMPNMNAPHPIVNIQPSAAPAQPGAPPTTTAPAPAAPGTPPAPAAAQPN